MESTPEVAGCNWCHWIFVEHKSAIARSSVNRPQEGGQFGHRVRKICTSFFTLIQFVQSKKFQKKFNCPFLFVKVKKSRKVRAREVGKSQGTLGPLFYPPALLSFIIHSKKNNKFPPFFKKKINKSSFLQACWIQLLQMKPRLLNNCNNGILFLKW